MFADLEPRKSDAVSSCSVLLHDLFHPSRLWHTVQQNQQYTVIVGMLQQHVYCCSRKEQPGPSEIPPTEPSLAVESQVACVLSNTPPRSLTPLCHQELTTRDVYLATRFTKLSVSGHDLTPFTPSEVSQRTVSCYSGMML